jgi:iron complex outermembrane recepter protein
LFGVVNGSGDVSGDPMERTPEFTASVGLDYHHKLFGGLLDLNGNYSYQTKSTFDFAGTLEQGSYGLLNLRAGWTDPSGHWNAAVIGRNVTDEVYLVQVLPNAGGFGQVFGQPANYMFNITYNY